MGNTIIAHRGNMTPMVVRNLTLETALLCYHSFSNFPNKGKIVTAGLVIVEVLVFMGVPGHSSVKLVNSLLTVLGYNGLDQLLFGELTR
jgi:hypothetical protein